MARVFTPVRGPETTLASRLRRYKTGISGKEATMLLVQPKHSAAALTFAAFIALLAPSANADCVDGVREPTPAEREAAQRGRAALIAGIPEAVRPLERRSPNRSDPAAPASLSFCRGVPIGAFSPSAADGYMYQFTREEAAARSEQRRALQRQVEDLEKLPPEKEAQRKEIEAQMRAAYAAAPTRSRKDPPFTPEQQAQVDRAQTEGRRLEDAMRRIEFDHRASVKPQTDPLRVRADELQQGPQIFSVALGMNVVRFPEPLPAARGIRLTFGAPSPKQSASMQPVNIVVTVEGPAGPARDALVGLIDRAYFEGLLNKPLPDVAASRKRIEDNMAQAASASPLAIAGSVPPAAAAPAAAAAAPAASQVAAAAPAAAAASGTAAATTASTPPAQRSANAAPCPPPSRTASSNDAQRSGSQVGAEVGGAVLGGGWGRSVGSSVGGVLGALGGGAKKEEPKPANTAADCPR
jgi:hypothetical protein